MFDKHHSGRPVSFLDRPGGGTGDGIFLVVAHFAHAHPSGLDEFAFAAFHHIFADPVTVIDEHAFLFTHAECDIFTLNFIDGGAQFEFFDIAGGDLQVAGEIIHRAGVSEFLGAETLRGGGIGDF